MTQIIEVIYDGKVLKPCNPVGACRMCEAEAEPISSGERASAWARLIKKVDGDPLKCPKCWKDMHLIAIILDPQETTKILRHLIKIGRPPPNFTIPGV